MNTEELERLQLKYTKRVIKEVSIRLGSSEEEADNWLKESAYQDLIDADPELVLHYPPRYWVDKLMNSQLALA